MSKLRHIWQSIKSFVEDDVSYFGVLVSLILVGFVLAFCFAEIVSEGKYHVSVSIDFNSLAAFFGAVFTGGLLFASFKALNSWKNQNKHNHKAELTFKTLELLRDLEYSHRTYIKALFQGEDSACEYGEYQITERKFISAVGDLLLICGPAVENLIFKEEIENMFSRLDCYKGAAQTVYYKSEYCSHKDSSDLTPLQLLVLKQRLWDDYSRTQIRQLSNEIFLDLQSRLRKVYIA
ncbi:hypothetical protein [Gayadomonas joobiniege]|uniref:hypothetical protein n=1 Tax=Gayadomonas joobiniege TaxID=1234606 RepID=UPI00037BC865|nr:hypothetical protein [Gayadomonas joobiniege]